MSTFLLKTKTQNEERWNVSATAQVGWFHEIFFFHKRVSLIKYFSWLWLLKKGGVMSRNGIFQPQQSALELPHPLGTGSAAWHMFLVPEGRAGPQIHWRKFPFYARLARFWGQLPSEVKLVRWGCASQGARPNSHAQAPRGARPSPDQSVNSAKGEVWTT